MVIKPQVKITFPWKLTLGNNPWLGEEWWLQNLEHIVWPRERGNFCAMMRRAACLGANAMEPNGR